MDKLKHLKHHGKSIKMNKTLLNAKENPKAVHNKTRSHKSTVNGTKNHTFNNDAQKHGNRISNNILNQMNYIASDGVTNGTDSTKNKHTVDQNNNSITIGSINGHYTHDHRTITQKFNAYRKSAR